MSRNDQMARRSRLTSVADGVGSFCHERHCVLAVVVYRSDRILTILQQHMEMEALLDVLGELVPMVFPEVQTSIQMPAMHIHLASPQDLLCIRRLDARHEHAKRVLGTEAVAWLVWPWRHRTMRGSSNMQACKAFLPHDVQLLTCWTRGITRFESRVRSSISTAWSGLIWPRIAPFRRSSFPCPSQASSELLSALTDRSSSISYTMAGSFRLFCSPCLTVQQCHMVLNHDKEIFP